MENYKYLITNAFALAGRMGHHVVPGVPLRSSPGSALAAFSRRPHPTNRNVVAVCFLPFKVHLSYSTVWKSTTGAHPSYVRTIM